MVLIGIAMILSTLTGCCRYEASVVSHGAFFANPALRAIMSTAIDGFNPGDRLCIDFMKEPFTNATKTYSTIVCRDGTITLETNEVFLAGGKTSSQLKNEILERHAINDTNHVKVLIGRTSYATYSVLGAVKTPGPQILVPLVTAFEAIQFAGGYTKCANLHRIVLYRANSAPQVFTYRDLARLGSKGPLLLPNDTLELK